MKSKNIFWGLFFILAAVVVVVLQVGGFAQVGFWTIVATVPLIGWVIQSLLKLDFGSLPFPIAVLYMLYQKPLGFFYIRPWLIIVIAILLSIGFSMLLGGLKRRNYYTYVSNYQDENGPQTHEYQTSMEHGALTSTQNNDDNFPEASVRFGAVSKYLHSTALESGRFESSFGAMEVYFDQATLSPNGADIFLDCSFGAISLYIPRHWRVVSDISVTLAGVDDEKHRNNPAPGAPELRLHGHASLAGVEIKYV